MPELQASDDLSAVHLGFDAQVPFNPGDGVDYDACHMSLLLAFL